MNSLLNWVALGVPALVLLVVAGCSMTRAGYRSPGYTVSARFERVEVRAYQSLVLAQTSTRKEAEGKDGSFMRLFRFITKGNVSAQPIPMTTPVLYRGEGLAESMAFVLPDGLKHAGVPAPLDARVHIETRPAGTYATLRMRGRRSKGRQSALVEMKAAVERSGWQLEGDPEFAFYDPPWTPWFMEKNEVMWRAVKRSSGN